jgi:hypothetical protein
MDENKNNPFSSKEGSPNLKIDKGGGGSSLFGGGSNIFDLKSTQGLYNIASQAGLQQQADDALRRAGGSEHKYLSGGFIMDGVDILNTLSYGMVGMAKGVGFREGINNRESFSDEDSLGKNGWQGKVAGFVLDIVADPLTYIAPWTAVSKIPGASKLLKSVKGGMLGELKTIEIEGQQLFQREGGWSPLTFLSDKVVYGFGADEKFLDSYRKVIGSSDNMLVEAEQFIDVFSKIDQNIAKKTIDFDEQGFRISKPWEQLQRELPEKELEAIRPLYDMKKSMMDELVDLGYLSKETAERNMDTYMHNQYDTFLEAKNARPSRGSLGSNYKARKEGMTKEERMALNPVDDAALVWGSTLSEQVHTLRNARLMKFVADKYSIATDQIDTFVKQGGDLAQLYKVPDAANYKLSGAEVSLRSEIKNLNIQIKSVLKERRKAFKDNKEVLSRIDAIENALPKLKEGVEENLEDAWNGFKQVMRDGGIKLGPTKKAATSKGQQALAESLTKWLKRGSKNDRLMRETINSKDLLKEFLETTDGWAWKRAFQDPRMMYQWKNPEDFFDAVRYPDRKIIQAEEKGIVKELTETQENTLVSAAEKKAREVGKLEQELDILSSANLKLIEDVVDKVENQFSDLLFEKQGVLEALNINKRGQLAGKYIPKPIWDMLKESMTPDKQVGEGIIMKFKKAKVIWNPSSYGRNAVSAMIQNWWELGLGPWRLDVYADAVKEMRGKGKFIKEMQELGFSEQSGVLSELRSNYMNTKVAGKNMPDKIPGYGTSKAFFKHVDRVLTNSYGHIDNVAKVAAYKHLRGKGINPEDALKQAYAATYNYSEVTPFIHQMRRAIWGVPFVTFSLKSVPLVARTIANNPTRISVIGKARNALYEAAGVEGEQELEAQPEWMRDDSFMLRLPWKDGEGRAMYFDLTYIVPFGALVTGQAIKEPFSNNPVLQTVAALAKNETFTGQRIFRESDDTDQVLFDITTFIGKNFIPPLADEHLTPAGYDKDGNRVWRGVASAIVNRGQDQELKHSERNTYQQIAKVLGASVQPFELDTQQALMDWRRQTELKKMLDEQGILSQFSKYYIGEDSPLNQDEGSLFEEPGQLDVLNLVQEQRPLGR